MSIDARSETMDADGTRRYVHPTEVRGFWQRRRQPVQFALIVFFLAIPWIRIAGKPLLLFDVMERRFSFFGVQFRAHDAPLVFLLAIGFILLVGLLTALFGRVWCGWACPQTVFIEAVFRRIETYCEGKAEVRRARDLLPMDFDLFLRRSAKWALYTCISLLITHSFLALFVSPDRLRDMITAGPSESPIAFGFILLSTLVVLADFGWLKEQFCMVACPYGRIQSVFQDSRTLTVAYDAKRGEPRGALRKEVHPNLESKGDCVNCFRCVKVCPTGIDIRQGSSQLECIGCTACIDACDDVMARLKRPIGLIRYASIEELESGGPIRRGMASLWRRRTVVFAIALAFVSTLTLVLAYRRTDVRVEVFKSHGEPYLQMKDADSAFPTANLFVAEMTNQTDRALEVRFQLLDLKGELIMPNNPIRLEPNQIQRQPFTIRFHPAAISDGRGRMRLALEITGGDHAKREEKEVSLVGPF